MYQARLLKTKASLLANDDVIENTNTKDPGRINKSLLSLYVRFALLQIARRVIMSKDHRSGTVSNNISEDIAWMREASIQ